VCAQSLILTGEGNERFEQVIPVTGVLGISLFHLADQKSPGILRVFNGTELLPLRVTVSCASADVAYIPPRDRQSLLSRFTNVLVIGTNS